MEEMTEETLTPGWCLFYVTEISVMFLLHKAFTHIRDATRCMRNMSAEADCIWHVIKRNKSSKIEDSGKFSGLAHFVFSVPGFCTVICYKK